MIPHSKLLVIDDEAAIRRFLRSGLAPHGYDVTEASTGAEGLARVEQDKPDLVLLDLGLPDGHGADLIPRIRASSSAPIVVLSARDDVAAKVNALDLGASDYVTKPFSMPELMARLRAATRHRLAEEGCAPIFVVNGLCVDLVQRRVTRGDKRIHLTRREYDCLHLFIRHAGKVLTHSYLLREIWGEQHVDKVEYLRSYMRMLRRKIETDPARPCILLTETGVGYRLEIDE